MKIFPVIRRVVQAADSEIQAARFIAEQPELQPLMQDAIQIVASVTETQPDPIDVATALIRLAMDETQPDPSDVVGLTLATLEVQPTPVDAPALVLPVTESHPTPVDQAILIAAALVEVMPPPVEEVLITVNLTAAESHPVPVDQVTLVGSVATEVHPTPVDDATLIAAITAETQPTPTDEFSGKVTTTTEEAQPTQVDSAVASSNTGIKYGTTDGILYGDNAGQAWSSPDQTHATEPNEGGFAQNVMSVTLAPDGKEHSTFGFQLLAEDGGTIPAGATITRLKCEYRSQIVNVDNIGADSTAQNIFRLHKGPVAGPLTFITSKTHANNTPRTTTAWTTITIDSQAGDFSISNISRADLDDTQLHLTYESDHLTGALGSSQCRVAWVRVTAYWELTA